MVGRIVPARAIAACVVGIGFEGFDFIVFSMFSFVIAKQYFPATDQAASWLLALLTFGLAYIVRPLGGIFWGVFADRVGRRPALVWISVSMAAGTALIAVAPTYAAIGLAAPLLMILARLIQGFSVSGEFASATAMLVELAAPDRRRFYASFQMAVQVATVAVGGAVVLVLSHALTHAQLESWGWRTVFVFGILIGPVGYYIRRRMAESPELTAYIASRGRPSKTPMREVLSTHRREVVCGAGLVAIGSGGFYLLLVYLPLFAARQLGLGMDAAQLSTIVSCAVQLPLCLLAGRLADRHGVRRVMLPATLLFMLLAYPLLSLLVDSPSFRSLVLVQLAMNVLLGFIAGPLPAAMSELFPVQLRSSGIGVVYNTVGAVFGGLGPFIVASLMEMTHNQAAAAYWAAALGAIGSVAIFFFRHVVSGRPGGDLPRRVPSVV